MVLSGLKQRLAALGARAADGVRLHPVLAVAVLFLVVKQTAVIWYILRAQRAPPNMLLALTGEALAIVAWAFVLEGWKRLAALAIVDLGTGALLLTDLFYFRQFADLPSVGSLKHAGLLGEMNGMGGMLEGIFHPVDLLLFAGTPLILVLGALHPKVRHHGRLRARRALQLTVVGMLMLVAVLATSARIRKPFGGHTMVASRLGPVGYHAYDLASQIGQETMRRLTSSDEELAALREFFVKRPERPPNPEFAGLAKGLNVIYVQLESWQSFPLFREVGGKPVTPNMDRLASESLYFPNFWSQVQQGTTSDAELLAQCSLYPSRTGSVYYDRVGADFHCLPEALRERGYRTVAMHGNRPDFWNRAAIYPSVGIDRFYDIRDFPDLPKIGLCTADVEFFDEAVRKLEREPQPFYAMLVSISSHNPFEFPEMPNSGLDFGRFANTRTAWYLNSVHYTDQAIGVLVDRLRATGLLDRSVLVIYGDHQGIAPDSSNVGEFLGIPEGDPVKTYEVERKVAALIHLPHDAHAGRYEIAAGQLDLAPTVARLVDVPLETTSFMGRDLMSDAPGFVAFPNGSVATASLLSLSADGGHGNAGCYTLPEGKWVPGDRCKPLADEAEQELEVSWRMLDAGVVDRMARTLHPSTASQP
jgi:phosphoglycerol transferase MdoB-like AlkP superfamily enzyme